MTVPDWTRIMEPDNARQARELGARFAKNSDAASSEADFWKRNDLVYIGDIQWAQAGYEGYEYIADIEARSSGGFHYIYGFVALTGQAQVAQTLVCEVRNHATEPLSFEMHIAGEWQPGPLRAWLDSLRPDVQMIASERYQNLIRWVRSTI
jgi:hypothetical protein